MPLDSTFRIALNPRRNDAGQIVAPNSVEEMLDEMNRLLPHWFLLALKNSGGADECLVNLNETPYFVIVVSWLWQEWKNSNTSFPLVSSFRTLGLESDDDVMSAILNGFCSYVKDGKPAAMKWIRTNGEWVKSQEGRSEDLRK